MQGSPADLTTLLDAAPASDHGLLELAVSWTALADAHARMASRLRLFVITRDPLGWIPGRGSAWATAYGDGDVVDELAVYVLLAEVRRRTVAAGDPEAAVAPFADAAVRAAADLEPLLVSGGDPAMAASGAAPRLLDRVDDAPALGVPSVTPRSEGWEPLGLGGIQDLVQDAFGPVDLDRSLVTLPPSERPDASCPACLGGRFGFPGEVTDAQARMCPPHRAAAVELIEARLARARTSNPAGWRAIGKASARINGLPEPGGTPLPPRVTRAQGRNDPCPCGSGRKYKRCCGA